MTARIRRATTALPRGVPALLAALALLLAIAAAGGPAASASVRSGCTWQPLNLLQGWQSDQSAYGTGDPMYCVGSGIVYLSGSLVHPGGGSYEFAVLPPQATPSSTVYLSVYTYLGAGGVVKIYPDGEMLAYGGSAAQFTSLAGISFPAAQSALAGQPLPLWNGWQSAQIQYGTGDPSYFVSGGIVHLTGSMTNPSAYPGGGFGILPADAAPAGCVETNTYAYNGAITSLTVDPAIGGSYVQDDPYLNVTSAAQFTTLTGISYPAAGAAWQQLPLQPGWAAQDGANCADGPPSYYVSGHVVYLTGAVLHTQSGNGVSAVLPPGARPVHTLYLTANTEGAPHANVRISPDGQIYLFGGAAPLWASLGGISYQQSS